MSGSAAAQCGEAVPHRKDLPKGEEATPPTPPRRSLEDLARVAGKAKPFRTVRRRSRFSTMRFSRAQIIGAIFILALIWLVIAIRLIISRA